MIAGRLFLDGFQSTLPARGATRRRHARVEYAVDFNPRSPHGERRPAPCAGDSRCNFNPRSPHGERRIYDVFDMETFLFQSTLPARGATIQLAVP